jgi:ribosomal protein L19
MNEIRAIEESQMKKDPLTFKVGDMVKVHFRIIEGKTERIQIYEGLVIAFKNSRVGRSFTVRKNSYGVGVERAFPLHSPGLPGLNLSAPERCAGPSSTISGARSARRPRSRNLSSPRRLIPRTNLRPRVKRMEDWAGEGLKD